MSSDIKNRIISQLSELDSAETVLIIAVNTEGIEGKLLIEAAIYLINQASRTVRDLLDADSIAERQTKR